MKVIDNCSFPETPEEAKCWAPFVTRRALHSKVLVVAKTRIEGAWAAYCAPVPGVNHDKEEGPVLLEGCKLPEVYARAMFNGFQNIPYAK